MILKSLGSETLHKVKATTRIQEPQNPHKVKATAIIQDPDSHKVKATAMVQEPPYPHKVKTTTMIQEFQDTQELDLLHVCMGKSF